MSTTFHGAAGPAAGRVAGKVALVVGAGSVGPGWGNGRACALLLAREGADVVAADRDEDALDPTVTMIREEGGSVRPMRCDVTVGSDVEGLVAATLAEHDRIDVLVNVVGGSRHGGVAELDPDGWHQQLETNLTSVYRTCRAVVPTMRTNGGGSIVNIASTSALRWSGSPQVGYASAKAGVVSLSRVSAVQYGPEGIRVNTVVPGQLHTPMVEARLAGQRAGGDADELLRQRAARVPLPIEGDGRDTAYAVLYLASDEARFVTGTEIVVDGGMTARCD